MNTIKSHQILPKVHQIELRKLQLEVEALWERVQNRSDENSNSKTNLDLVKSTANSFLT